MRSFLKKDASIYSDKPIFGKRPLFFAAVFFLAGILLASQRNVSVLGAYLAGASFLALHAIFRKWRYTGAFILAAVFFFGMGSFSCKIYDMRGSSGFAAIGDAEITGRVREKNIKSYGGATYRLADVSVNGESLKHGVFVYCNDEDYELDDVISCEGTLRSPKPKSYEFGFDDELYCAANGAALRMSAEDARIEYHKEDALSVINAVRQKIGAKMDELFKNSAPIAKAMLIGIDEEIDSDTLSMYRSAGISHILCISGLHVGIICWSVYSILKRLKANRFLRYAVSMLVLIAYAALAGFRTSVMRSSVMFAVMLTGDAFYKDYDALTSLSAAFAALTLINPCAVFDVGFQLSFGAVFSILCISGTVFRRHGSKNTILTAAVTSAAAFLGNALIISNMNNEISFLALAVNPFAVALACVTVPLIAVITVLYCIFGGAFVLLGYAGIYFISLLNNIAYLSELTALSVKMPALHGVVIFAGFAAIFICSKYTLVRRRTKLLSCCILALIIPASLLSARVNHAKLRIDILADSYSNCAVITTDEGKCFVIDAGDKSGGYLEDYGLKPDAVFLTAARSKSIGGIDGFKDAEIYAPGGCAGDERLSECNAKYLYGGEKIPLSQDAVLTVTANRDNTRACFYIECGGRTAFTYLSASPDEQNRVKTDAVFLNSITKSVPDYISKASPDYAVIKSDGTARLEGVTLIDTEYAGCVSVFIYDTFTEVTSEYECRTISL